MESSWSARRKLIYGLSTIIVLILLGLYIFRDALFPAPTCSDRKQNGYEEGVDCGGTCSLRCPSSVIPLSVSWTRVLRTGTSTYDVAALVSNKNIDSSTQNIPYTFIIRDANGNVMSALQGTTIVPVDGDFPVVAKNVMLSGVPSSVELVLATSTLFYKVHETASNPTLRLTSMRYEEGATPRLYATIVNTKRISLSNVPIRAVLYDEEGNAFAVGQSVIRTIGKEDSQDVVFTWNNPFPIVPTKIRVYPIFDPFLAP